MTTTRATIAKRIAAGDSLKGLRLALPRGVRELSAIEPEEREMVREELGDEAAEGRLVRFKISTEVRAADGHVIHADAWDLERYRSNPIVLWQHDRFQPRVADSVVWTEEADTYAVAAFYPREVNEFSAMLGEMTARRGHAASVGFDILEAEPAPPEVLQHVPWALDITSARLEEWSLVNLGADPDALAEARAYGIDTSPAARHLERVLDEVRELRAQLAELYAAARGDPPIVVDMGARRGAHSGPDPETIRRAAREALRRSFGS
jgi:hypothetical protein